MQTTEVVPYSKAPAACKKCGRSTLDIQPTYNEAIEEEGLYAGLPERLDFRCKCDYSWYTLCADTEVSQCGVSPMVWSKALAMCDAEHHVQAIKMLREGNPRLTLKEAYESLIAAKAQISFDKQLPSEDKEEA
jgi:hypothetical protein